MNPGGRGPATTRLPRTMEPYEIVCTRQSVAGLPPGHSVGASPEHSPERVAQHVPKEATTLRAETVQVRLVIAQPRTGFPTSERYPRSVRPLPTDLGSPVLGGGNRWSRAKPHPHRRSRGVIAIPIGVECPTFRKVQVGGWPRIRSGIHLRAIRHIDHRSTSPTRHIRVIQAALRRTRTLPGTTLASHCLPTTDSVLAAGCSTG